MSEEKKKNVGGQEPKPQAAPAGKTPTQKPAQAQPKAEPKPAQKPQQKPIGKPAGKKPEPPPATGAARVLRILYIVLTVISALIVLGYIFWKIFAAPPSVDNNPGRPSASRSPIIVTTDDPEHPGQKIEVELPALPGDRKKEFYTFLMVGQSQDAGGKLTDTMMLAAYDVPNQKLSIMSIPRDTYVKYNGRTRLINEVYNVAGNYKDDEKGVEGLKKAIQELTGVYPDFHAVIRKSEAKRS